MICPAGYNMLLYLETFDDPPLIPLVKGGEKKKPGKRLSECSGDGMEKISL